MVESSEITEKHGVVFILWDGEKIQLEKRLEEGTEFFGYTIIPGGAIETSETQEEALLREVCEEYGVVPSEYRKVGIVDTIEQNGTLNFRHVFLVTGWNGQLSNPEDKNEHIKTTLEEARKLCTHPISQRILDLVGVEIFSARQIGG